MKELTAEYGRFLWAGHGEVILDLVDRVAHPEGRLWWWGSMAPEKCYAVKAPDPPKAKEPEIRKLATGYSRVREPGPDGRTLIFRDGETGLPEFQDGSRRCWIEGQGNVPDRCYAPKPAPPAMPTGSQEFREGDLLRVSHYDGTVSFRLYVGPSSIKANVRIQDACGRTSAIPASRAELIERSSTPTGPPVVGSYVGIRKCPPRDRGVVGEIRHDRPDPYHAFFANGTNCWCRASELVHLAAPRSPEDD